MVGIVRRTSGNNATRANVCDNTIDIHTVAPSAAEILVAFNPVNCSQRWTIGQYRTRLVDTSATQDLIFIVIALAKFIDPCTITKVVVIERFTHQRLHEFLSGS